MSRERGYNIYLHTNSSEEDVTAEEMLRSRNIPFQIINPVLEMPTPFLDFMAYEPLRSRIYCGLGEIARFIEDYRQNKLPFGIRR